MCVLRAVGAAIYSEYAGRVCVGIKVCEEGSSNTDAVWSTHSMALKWLSQCVFRLGV